MYKLSRPFLTLCLLSGPMTFTAFADDAPSGEVPNQAPEDRAVVLAGKAKEAFVAGRFDDAIALYTEVRSLTSEAVVLRNLAKSHEAAGGVAGTPRDATIAHFEAAVGLFEQYLAESDPADRTDIERRITSLREIARKLRETVPAPPRATSVEPAVSEVSPAPWVVLGVGAATLTAAGIMGGIALATQSAAESAPNGEIAFEKQSDADRFALASNVLFGVGATTALVGGIWGIVDLASRDTKAAGALVFSIGASSASLRLTY